MAQMSRSQANYKQLENKILYHFDLVQQLANKLLFE